jgi:cyanate permease
MYSILVFLHSLFRWLVVVSLLFAIYRAYIGYRKKREFTNTDNLIRHWAATIAHIQLMIGMGLYTQSPIVRYFWKNKKIAVQNFDVTFYALVHAFMMLVAIVVITIGSSLAKRKEAAADKYKTMLVWFMVAFIIIFIAIPWPFSPLSKRPYFR